MDDTLLQEAVDSLIGNYDSSYYIDAYDHNEYNDRYIEQCLIQWHNAQNNQEKMEMGGGRDFF